MQFMTSAPNPNKSYSLDSLRRSFNSFKGPSKQKGVRIFTFNVRFSLIRNFVEFMGRGGLSPISIKNPHPLGSIQK